jgi:hypothetical protein
MELCLDCAAPGANHESAAAALLTVPFNNRWCFNVPTQADVSIVSRDLLEEFPELNLSPEQIECFVHRFEQMVAVCAELQADESLSPVFAYALSTLVVRERDLKALGLDQ